MMTRNNLRKLAREISAVLALFIAVLGGTLLFNANKQAEGFMTYHQKHGLHDIGILFLIEHVHEDQWDIAYRIDPDCPASSLTTESVSDAEWAIESAIRLWLEPLEELAKQRNKRLVDKFTFHRDGDLAENRLRVTFLCQPGNSSARLSSGFPPEVLIRGLLDGWSPEDYWIQVDLVHEIGHAFGLADTYASAFNADPDKSVGLKKTIGNQPPSMMSASRTSNPPRVLLGEDDKRGIRWLYRYVYDGNVDLQDCLNDDYVFEQLNDYVFEQLNDDVGGCVPRYPLAFAVKYGLPMYFIRTLDEDPKLKDIPDEDGYTALHYLSIRRLQDPMERYLERTDFDINVKNRHGDTPLHLAVVYDTQYACEHLVADARIKVNALNTLNYTPLHYAARYGRVEIVKLLLAHEDINPNLRNAAGFTPLQLATQGGAVSAADSDESLQADYPELWALLWEEKRQHLIARLSPAALQQAHAEIAALLRAHPGIILPDASDVNGDGVVNILDLVKVSNAFGQRGQIPEDVNGDGVVNVQDLVWVSGAFGQ